MRKRGAVFNKITALVLAIVMVAALIAGCRAKPGHIARVGRDLRLK